MLNLTNALFVLFASILVFSMTPGLAFFYGGLVSAKNVVNTMISIFSICGIGILLFIGCGYGLCFSGNHFGIIGNFHHLFLAGINLMKPFGTTHIPLGVYLIFQLMFALVTPALFVGATVGRMKFNYFITFVCVWTLVVYYPLVHIVWSPAGLLAQHGLLDFAGGTVVHINAGITALVLSILLGKRSRPSKDDDHYNLPWILLGTTFLWIGWYGFNAGSALGINHVALQAFMTTTIATASAMVSWMIFETLHGNHPDMVGICTGALCGLVGITPAAGYVTDIGAVWIGILCTLVSFTYITFIKPHLKYDDPLDAFGCHGVSGIVGSILVGIFATSKVNPSIHENGLLYGGGWHLLGIQFGGTLFTIIFVAIMTWGCAKLIALMIPMRVSKQAEDMGLDQSEHGESVDYMVRNIRDLELYRNEFKGQLSHLYHDRK